MNILIPHKWLTEHLETTAIPEEIQKYLSLCGPSVERIYDIEGDKVYDIEVTTNRVDSMNVRGIAREAGVILSQFGIKSKLKPLELSDKYQLNTDKAEFPQVENDPKLCGRTIGVVLKNIKRNPTPDWMATKLKQVDIQVHEAAIDITNYVTHEVGHPIHAFDYDKLMATGGKIIVKQADAGKKFSTLDGEEYQTLGGEIVFENEAGEIIDLPAIKGTANTSVDDNTQNILLWMENLDPVLVRKASMAHAIRTVAAQLNEKNVDPNLAEPTLKRAIDLYVELCEAKIASQIIDNFPGKRKLTPVKVKLQKIHDYLGIELETTKIVKILENLGCQVQIDKAELTVQPPTFRPDIEIPEDIIEEVARIYGYHELPSVVMPTRIPLKKPAGVDFSLENMVKHFLADIGWQEVYTYSMVSEEIAKQSDHKIDDHLKLNNPLTEDRVYLRRSLIPSLAEVIDANPQREELTVYELANVYQPIKNELPEEKLHLAIVSSADYRQVKGGLEALMAKIFISPDEFIVHKDGQIIVEQDKTEHKIGNIQILNNGYSAIDIIWSEFLKIAKKYPTYQPLAKTAAILEDLTFTLPEKTPVGEIMTEIKQVDPLVKTVMLGAVYQNNYTFQIEYWDKNKNLTKEEVEPIRKTIVDHLEQAYQAKLVGSV